MGVYNEVIKKCPHCETGHGVTQVKSIGRHEVSILRLDDLDALADQMTDEEMTVLHEKIRDQHFRCEDPDCDRSFLLDETRESRLATARRLFG